MSVAKLDFRVGADKSALTHRETAKEARSTSSCSFAPWGEGGRRSDEGSNVKVDLSNPPPRICKLITFANKFLSSPSERTILSLSHARGEESFIGNARIFTLPFIPSSRSGFTASCHSRCLAGSQIFCWARMLQPTSVTYEQ